MALSLEEILEKLKNTPATSQSGGAVVDEATMKKLVDQKVAEVISNPQITNRIMSEIIKKPSSPDYIKFAEFIKDATRGSKKVIECTDAETRIIDDMLAGNNVYLLGKAGTGKTYMAEKIAEALKETGYYSAEQEPYWTINCSQWTSPIDIIGGYTIDGYKQGTAIEAWIKGGVLILDELPKLDPNTAGLLNDMLAKTARENVRIKDGNGVMHLKNKKFHVIGTGNTDLKSVGGGYSGNNRQDYSLFDRFAGSMHEINYNIPQEKQLNYGMVFCVSQGLREFLDQDPSSVESISLRTMLNFGRIYQLEMLRKIDSPLAPTTYCGLEGKTFKESVMSFIDRLSADKKNRLITQFKFSSESSSGNISLQGWSLIDALDAYASDPIFIENFISEYERLTKINPHTGKEI